MPNRNKDGNAIQSLTCLNLYTNDLNISRFFFKIPKFPNQIILNDECVHLFEGLL